VLALLTDIQAPTNALRGNYRHPLPEHEYDVYIKYWNGVAL
jgi:hypothetical protein